MGLAQYASNFAETKELHSVIELRTRYYKNKYTEIRDVFINYAEENNIEIKSINDNHGEIYLQAHKYHVILTIVQINPLETAAEVKVQTYQVMGRNKPQKIIKVIYSELDNKLKFKGISLHP